MGERVHVLKNIKTKGYDKEATKKLRNFLERTENSQHNLFCNNSVNLIKRFSNDCRNTKTKATTPTNHKRNEQRDEPTTISSNHL